MSSRQELAARLTALAAGRTAPAVIDLDRAHEVAPVFDAAFKEEGRVVAEPARAELVCPECAREEKPGTHRIGNRRSDCRTCNSFAQRVLRTARAELIDAHPAEFAAVRARVETRLYAELIGASS